VAVAGARDRNVDVVERQARHLRIIKPAFVSRSACGCSGIRLGPFFPLASACHMHERTYVRACRVRNLSTTQSALEITFPKGKGGVHTLLSCVYYLSETCNNITTAGSGS
jgi:hypothetical protein